MFSCRQNAFLLSPDSRQERTTRSICSSVCFMITVFHKAKHKLPSCKDVLARVLTNNRLMVIGKMKMFGKLTNLMPTLLTTSDYDQIKSESPRIVFCENVIEVGSD